MKSRNRWLHSVCRYCWDIMNPDLKPCTVNDREVEICCYCGKRNASGIYFAEHPKNVRCQGSHDAKDTKSK